MNHCKWCGRPCQSGSLFCGEKCRIEYEEHEARTSNSVDKLFGKGTTVSIILAAIAFFVYVGKKDHKQGTNNSPAASQQSVVTADNKSASFAEGKSARQAWENWISSLHGDAKKGALYWASVRSQSSPPGCDGSQDFAQACFTARKKLEAFDARRMQDQGFRSGWNSL